MTRADHRDHERRAGVPALARYSLRPLRLDDLDAISRVHWRACRIASRFMGWLYGEDQGRRWYAERLREWDWARVRCAGQVVVGHLAATGAHTDQLFVDRGPRPVTLSVFADNAPG